MPQVQDLSFNLLTCSLVHYHCAKAAPNKRWITMAAEPIVCHTMPFVMLLWPLTLPILDMSFEIEDELSMHTIYPSQKLPQKLQQNLQQKLPMNMAGQ